jgi:hypothetical protein
MNDLHPKVKAGAIAGILATVLTALAGTVGAGEPPWVAVLLTAIASLLAGYATPSTAGATDGDK